jgi:uncharacterized protein (TIGR02145 family)
MKRIFTILAAVLLTASVFAQAPEKMSYQAVIRNSSDVLVTNTTVGMQISILQGSASGTVVYTETQTPTTNANGLVSMDIGSGAGFSTIDWANDIYFIKTETDPTGGTNYTIIGTSQLLSVPYALHAKTAESVSGGITETDPQFNAWNKSTGIVISESQITDLQSYLTSETDPSVPTGTATGQMQYWNGTAWITVAPGTTGQVLTFVSGVPTWKPIEGKTDVTNPTTGEIWMDRNLGALQVATSSTDAAAYGDLYQWGRAADGHQIRTSGTTTTLGTTDTPVDGNFIIIVSSPYDWRSPQNDNLWQGVSGINNPCPSGYRLPTEAEWEAEHTSWGSNNSAGAFTSPLKLPVAGDRSCSNGSLFDVGSNGNYWSSTVDGTNSRCLFFYSSIAYMASNYRAYGFSVRCLKD